MLLMRIYVFVSRKDADVLAFTLSETGDNLPAALGPWYQEVIPGFYVIGHHCPVNRERTAQKCPFHKGFLDILGGVDLNSISPSRTTFRANRADRQR